MRNFKTRSVLAKAVQYRADNDSAKEVQDFAAYLGGGFEISYDGFSRDHLARMVITGDTNGGSYLIKENEWFIYIDGALFVLGDKEFREFYEEVPEERQSNLVDHAKRELEIIGEEPEVVDAYLKIVRIFADMGHSGASAMFAAPVIERLLSFKPLSELTDDPEDWIHVGEDIWGEKGGIYQNRRNGEAFSKDGGKTYYLLSDHSNAKIQTKWYTSKKHKK